MNRRPSKYRGKPTVGEVDQKGRLLLAVNGAAEILLTMQEDQFEDSLREGMELMARCMDVDRIYIWQNIMMNGQLHYIQQFAWVGDSELKGKTVDSKTGFSYFDSIPEWEARFAKGECVNGPLYMLSRTERDRLEPYGIKSILVIPVYIREYFWGFVSFDDCQKERVFTEDEISILRSANLMLVSAMDRHETAAKMREADEHAKLMLEATPLCCSLWDKDINIIDCNAEVVSFYGLKNKQEYLDSFFELLPEYQPDGSRSAEKARELIAATFREGRMVFEWIHQMPNGEPVPTEVTLVRVRRGDEYIVAGYTRDLREYKKMIGEIEYKGAILRTVNEVAGILLRSETDEFEDNLRHCMGMLASSVDADRMYIWRNHVKDGKMYSTQLYEWSERVKPQQGGRYAVDIPYTSVPRWEQELPAGQCINGIVRLLTPQERTFLGPQDVLSVLAVPVFLHNQYWGFVGFDDCHRERVFSEEEESILRSGSLLIANALLRNEMTHDIQAASERALDASKAKSAFLAHMSHEIRTPMNVIAGMAELVLREDMSAAVYEPILSIKHASASMLSLINDILDFSKIEAGNLEIASNEYALTSLINDVLIIIRMRVSEKPIHFTTNIDCNIPNRLIGDDTRIRQILLNVLDNAAKYTAEGFISLTVTGEIAEDTVTLTAEVSDSGIGIKEADIDGLFGEFIRVDGKMNNRVQGTGLGLAITKNLCKAMGGDITVRSEYGVGSNFTITIPQKIKSHDEKFAKVAGSDTKRVLLYETRATYADSIVRSLDNLGVHCTLVYTQKGFAEELGSRVYSFVFVPTSLSESAGRMIGELKLDTTLVLLLEFGETPAMHNVRTISLPIHSASIANVLNDNEDGAFYNERGRENVRFIAPSANILVVDDLNTNLRVAQGLMLPYQMQIDVCESGEAAIECAAKKRYDIIFMDHMMPGMNGIEATHRIRAMKGREDGYYQNLPIIALTANAISGVKEMFLSSGMNDFLAKPIDVTKLRGLLEKWIPAEKKEKVKKTRAKLPSADMNPSWVQMEGVDTQAGIAMSGGTVESYLKTLTVFQMDGAEKLEQIRDCLRKDDVQTYTVYVHSLKSAAATVGAQEVSELFKMLETAGMGGDTASIYANTEQVLRKFEALLENIAVLLAQYQNKSKNDCDPEFLRNGLTRLREALSDRDAGEVGDIMKTLEAANWDQQTGDLFKQISKNIFLFNYTEAVILVDKLIGSLAGT